MSNNGDLHNTSQSKWFFTNDSSKTKTTRVFCFPYAGGGISAFYDWTQRTTDFIQFYAIQLPGRENRWKETPYTSIAPLTEILVRELEPHLDRPFAFFGHSMGALIAFELTRVLRRANLPQPVHLFLAAHRAPHLPLVKRPIYDLPKDEFEKEIRLLQGTDDKVFENRELLEFVTPTLRADLALCETYCYYEEPPLDIPFSVWGGTNDAEVNEAALEPWRVHTSQSMKLKILPGDHFFLRKQKEILIESISKKLNIVLTA